MILSGKLRIIGLIFSVIGIIVGLVAFLDREAHFFSFLSPDGVIGPGGVRVLNLLGLCLAVISLFIGVMILKYRFFLKFASGTFKKLDKIPDRQWLFFIIVLSLALRVAWIIYLPSRPVSDFAEYYHWGLRLSRGEPYNYRQGLGYGSVLVPTAYKPPGFPLFLAGVFKICGPSLEAAKLAQAALGTLACLLLFYLVKEVATGFAAKLSALILAVYPPYIFAASLIASEHLLIIFLLPAIICFLKGMVARSYFWMVASGILLGCSIMVKSQAIFFPVAFALAGLLSEKRFFSRCWPLMLTLLIVSYAATVPWQWRNYRIHHHWGIIALNGGVTFFHSNTPRGIQQIPPLKTRLLREGYSEYEMDRWFYRKGWENIKRHPFWVIKNIVTFKLRRFFSFLDQEWLAQYNLKKTSRKIEHKNLVFHLIVYISVAGYSLLFLAFLYGLLTSGKFNLFQMLCAMIIIYWIISVIIFHGNPRYRYPLIPLYAYFAALGITRLAKRLNRLSIE